MQRHGGRRKREKSGELNTGLHVAQSSDPQILRMRSQIWYHQGHMGCVEQASVPGG